MKGLIFNELNKKQKEAVEYVSGSSVILAGAGSGKTRVLVHKVLHLIKNHNVSPQHIVMITFTNKAANEMKQRIMRTLNLNIGYVGTFHSFCAQLLRKEGPHIGIEHSFTIYNQDDHLALIKSILKKIDTKKITPSYVVYRISAAKNQLITPKRYFELFSDYNAATIAEVYEMYQKELEKNHALDFDDLIMKTCELFRTHKPLLGKYQDKYRYLLVDEFQDTNYAQYVLTLLVGSKYKNVTVVGDLSQSIYSWRGADIRNLEKFREDFPDTKLFYLEQNYRSTQNILDFAYEVISQNETHPILKLHTRNFKGEEITFYQGDTEQDEALYVVNEIERLCQENIELDYSSFAVLYRINAQSRVVEESLLHHGISYVLIGGIRFYERKEIKDILSYLRLFVNQEDNIARERIKKLGKKKWERFKEFYLKIASQAKDISTVELMEKIFNETGYLELYNPENPDDYTRLENIKELKSVALNFPDLVQFLEQVALVESEYFEGEKKNGEHDGVRLMTLHQAKGLEFSYVFIVGVEEGILPHSRAVHDLFELEEERRLFYVGITRAQRKLYITHAQRRFIFGRRGDSIKSRFLDSRIY